MAAKIGCLQNFLVGKHITSGRKALNESTVEALKLLRAALIANNARKVSGSLADHIHIYVDASYDADGFSGIGGICFNSSGKVLGFFSEEAPPELLEVITIGGEETAIMELDSHIDRSTSVEATASFPSSGSLRRQ